MWVAALTCDSRRSQVSALGMQRWVRTELYLSQASEARKQLWKYAPMQGICQSMAANEAARVTTFGKVLSGENAACPGTRSTWFPTRQPALVCWKTRLLADPQPEDRQYAE